VFWFRCQNQSSGFLEHPVEPVWKFFSRADATPQAVCVKILLTNVCNGFIAATTYSPGGRQWQLLLKFGHPARIGSPPPHFQVSLSFHRP
jgi:hypothetical protein